MNELERLKQKLIRSGFGAMDGKMYPIPYMAIYVEIKYPNIAKEFFKWFDDEVRGWKK